ncbi:isoleucyl-tRNA synthetase [Marinitoga sp. 1197]|uniref:isoleucine--tRNA ligase n=1 Tax=Marinitoga sp. 1197 TaxID=1428449 RepID=UPI0006416EBF|nr:isoleucine--tRNA ligase [Marinitoga sp. 1197]KLO23754.1 isoleucyl-tRNA synthetase [Marinitoga sp. 1197]
MDYKDTLNLPKTSFKMKANLKTKEPETLKKWEKMNLEHYIRKERENAPTYILHDGPPYANGHIHIGHALNKVLKDIIIKYKTMKGYNAPYVPGWDTHGLPIEHKVTTDLGEKAKTMSKLEIRKLCEDYALNFVNIQKEEFKRLGIRGDWENPYVTLKPEYEAKVLEILKKMVEDGNVFRNKKPIYWCPSCETALAEAEIEYHDHTSHSIYVKFELEDEPNTYVVIWTTTPWTLPANVAIALHPDFDYVKVQVGNEKWILAKGLMENLLNIAGVKDYEILEEFKGKDLEYKKAKHPFMNRESLIVLADYVTLEDGTGCVHTAPGHGAEDYQTGLKYKLPVLSPVNHEGIFTDEAGKYKGLHIWKANKIIINDLRESGHLIAQTDIRHSYPHCWRCKNPVIFRATEQWFISVDKNNLREKALDEIKKVKWIPDWGENRITAMVQDRPDWCISRQRAWGIPIPALYCEDCGETYIDPIVMDKVIEIVEKEGTNAWYERDVKDFLPEGYKCKKCGGTHFKKEEDILDVWIDSGSSWDAVVNVRKDLNKYPVDLYLEGTDQHRGWFQSSLFLSVAKNGIAPYETVLTHGFIKDKDGRKMSKSLGNVISPFDVIEKYGADILRLWVASSDYRGDIRVSFDILKQQTEVYRKYRNTIRFLLGNTSDFDPQSDSVPYEKMEELDKWAMMKIHQLIEKVTEAYENYEFFRVHHLINKFCTVEMSSIYLDIIKDRIYTELPKSKLRRSAQTVMYEALVVLTKLMVPLLAFTTEEIYSYLPTKKYETVQLEKWPEVNMNYIDKKLEEKWNKIFQLREDVTKALEEKRREKFIGHPLDAKIIVEPKSSELKEILNEYDPYFIADLFITSQFELGTVDEGFEGEYSKVKVVKAEGKKCERCWKIHPEVGKNEKYPDACPRCVNVLEQL